MGPHFQFLSPPCSSSSLSSSACPLRCSLRPSWQPGYRLHHSSLLVHSPRFAASLRSSLFTICAAVFQVSTAITYTVSASPGGTRGAKFLASSLGSTVLRFLGLSLAEESLWLSSVTQGNGVTTRIGKCLSSVSDSLSRTLLHMQTAWKRTPASQLRSSIQRSAPLIA
jgi:hypothetical protein